MELPNPREFTCHHHNKVCWPQCEDTGSYYIQLLDMGAGSILSEGASVVHHKKDEMLLKQNTVSDGQAAFHIKYRAYHVQSLDSSTCRPDLGFKRFPTNIHALLISTIPWNYLTFHPELVDTGVHLS